MSAPCPNPVQSRLRAAQPLRLGPAPALLQPADVLVGKSPARERLAEACLRVASAAAPLLLLGETGTGKERLARLIHTRSARAQGPFVSASCSALEGSSVDAELFGSSPLQGPVRPAEELPEPRRGAFLRADQGTLYLDEVGDLGLSDQAKLLRVIESGEIRRPGVATRQTDVRLIAASRHDLEDLVAQGRFRSDLLYRLRVLVLAVPPLRERREDVPELAARILARLAEEQGRPAPLLLSSTARRRLIEHHWPGNLRELTNALRRADLFSKGPALDEQHLALEPSGHLRADNDLSYRELLLRLEERERAYVQSALERSDGNKARAARELGVSRYALYRTLRRLDLSAQARPFAEVDLGEVSGGHRRPKAG